LPFSAETKPEAIVAAIVAAEVNSKISHARVLHLKRLRRPIIGRFEKDWGVRAARDIFGEDEDNVRFYGSGVPNVFLDGDDVTDAALERLLNWS
jgi:hypothetical protein